MSAVRSVAKRVAAAKALVGSRRLSGWCEKFVRQSFGFPARYASATLAWQDTERRHADISSAPAGVPVFWELHPANKNHGLGHVALSVGGGYCISTSVGPGGAIGKVGIDALTRAWQMTPRGWTEDYHGRTVWTPPANSKPKAPASGRGHVLSDEAVRRRVKASGVPRPKDGLLSTWVRQWQERQLYAPGLVADGVWGPASEAHYQWTRALQRAMRGWKGDLTAAIDGDYYKATRARVRELQQRNAGGAYRGAIDSIPGPVFCAMLGIPAHPGL